MRKSYQKALNILRDNSIAEVRLYYESSPTDFYIKESDNIKPCLFATCGELEHRETMWAILLNRRNRVLGKYIIATGGVSGLAMDIKLLLQSAILANATGIILAHNHPSGNLNPSEVDIKLTRRVKQACELCDLTLLDHLIITTTKTSSIIDY